MFNITIVFNGNRIYSTLLKYKSKGATHTKKKEIFGSMNKYILFLLPYRALPVMLDEEEVMAPYTSPIASPMISIYNALHSVYLSAFSLSRKSWKLRWNDPKWSKSEARRPCENEKNAILPRQQRLHSESPVNQKRIVGKCIISVQTLYILVVLHRCCITLLDAQRNTDTLLYITVWPVVGMAHKSWRGETFDKYSICFTNLSFSAPL